MKALRYFLTITTLLITFSCSNSTVVTSEEIEVIIDGNSTDFSNNIDAKLVQLPATTGFTEYFSITSEDSLGNPFSISRIFPTTTSGIILPITGVFPVPESYFITSFGLDIDDGNSGNNLTYTITSFGLVGEQIEATISGVYYDSFNASHSLQININVTRDQ